MFFIKQDTIFNSLFTTVSIYSEADNTNDSDINQIPLIKWVNKSLKYPLKLRIINKEGALYYKSFCLTMSRIKPLPARYGENAVHMCVLLVLFFFYRHSPPQIVNICCVSSFFLVPRFIILILFITNNVLSIFNK